MAQLIDQVIKISISSAASTPDTTAFTIGLALASGTKPVAYGTKTTKRYFDADEVKTDWTDTSKAYAIARDYFGQEVKPEYLIIASYGATESAEAVDTALTAALAEDNSFYHVLGDLATYVGYAAAGDFCNANYKVSHFDTANADTLDPLEVDDPVSLLDLAGHGRVSIWHHVDPTGTTARDDSLSGGITGLRCGKDPAKGSWAHKELAGITPDALTPAQFKAATDKHANVFVKMAGVSRTFFGSMADGSFIDSVIKADWIRARIQERIYALLGSANDGDGLDMNDNGIQAVKALISATLSEAADQNHKYILDDFTVSVPKFSDISSVDKAKRNLPLVQFRFSIQESINTVKDINGAIVA